MAENNSGSGPHVADVGPGTTNGTARPIATPRVCVFDGCGRAHLAKGLCGGHYRQLRVGSGLRPLTPRWTPADIQHLRDVYAGKPSAAGLDLGQLASALGRDKANVCRKARQLGLTDLSRPKVAVRKGEQASFFVVPEFQAAIVGARTRRLIKESGHPRGMLGKKHTEETKKAGSEASRAMWADPNSKINSPEASQRRSDLMIERIKNGEMRQKYSRGRGGRRADLENRYFRSSWEANYARLLNFRQRHGDIAAWDYECQTFEFPGIKRGTRLYTPDFKVTFPDGRHEWHEVKGWMDDKSKVRTKRFAKFFPLEKLVIIGAESFKAFKRQGFDRMISTWE